MLTHEALCVPCFRAVTLIGPPHCDRCGTPFLHAGQGEAAPGTPRECLLCPGCLDQPPDYGRARAAFLYDAGAKRLLMPFKYGDRTELARPLARHMAWAGRDLLASAELLVPVPLHRRRLLTRRYNQAALLAARLSRLSGVPWAPGILRRPRRTPPLSELGAHERAAVLEAAFALSRGGAGRVSGRRVLLVDDVLTSGATVTACARLLLAAGASGVDVLAVARVPDPRLREDAADRPRQPKRP